MNRRQFLQTTATATGALFLPFSVLAATPKPKISWEDFDWMGMPSQLAFRIEIRNGKHHLASIPYLCRTWKTKLCYSEKNPDLTAETFVIDKNKNLPKVWHQEEGRFQTIYTNEILLLEAKNMGITHIYQFLRGTWIINPVTYQRDYTYYVRGARLPEWKTNRGKLQCRVV